MSELDYEQKRFERLWLEIGREALEMRKAAINARLAIHDVKQSLLMVIETGKEAV